MSDALLNLIPGGGLTAIGGVILALLVAFWRTWAAGKKAGKSEERANDVDAYEKHLQDIAEANRARDSVDPGGVSVDPHNRDNKRK